MSVSQAFNDNLSLTGPENSHILWRTVNEMNRLDLDTQILIQEINELWELVYPHLAKHISGAYGRKDGVILEVGPFLRCYLFIDVARRWQPIHDRFFPDGNEAFFQ